ncbi:PiggyBac transposable element-derived protein 4 [Anthophora retusa]
MPIIQNKLKTGEASFRSSRYLLAMRWYDKREVYMLSPFHSEEFVETKRHYQTREIIKKPKCVVDYNKLMRTVDKTDMVISTIHSQRKALKCIANKSGQTNPLRLTGRHFPSLYTNEKTKRKNPLRKCVICLKNDTRSGSQYQCQICNVGLCVTPCFGKYHTQLHY